MFHKDRAEGMERPIHQLCCAPDCDRFIRVSNPLPHRHPDMAQPGLCQAAAQLSRAVLPPYQYENSGVNPNVYGDIPRPPVEADGDHVLIGDTQPGAEADQRAQARNQFEITVLQQRQQLLCPAVKPHIPAHDHSNPAAEAVLPDGGGHILSGYSLYQLLPRAACRLQHPGRAYNAPGIP